MTKTSSWLKMCRLKICLRYLSSALWHVSCFLHNITNFVIKIDIHGLRTICTIIISCWTLTCIIYHASTWYPLLSSTISTIRINMAKGFETNPLSSFFSSFFLLFPYLFFSFVYLFPPGSKCSKFNKKTTPCTLFLILFTSSILLEVMF